MRTISRVMINGLIIMVLMIFPAAGTPQKVQPQSAWDLLRKIVMVPGISRQESKAADFIQTTLTPSLADVQRDEMNNVWVTVGRGKPSILFVAHMDELGMTVEKITPQGTLKTKGSGGVFVPSWEGRPVLVHTAKGPKTGIVAPRPGYDRSDGAKTPFQAENIEIYLGVTSEAEARGLGVREGDAIIFKKRIADLSPDIMATRAVDDRAGCAAVLEAALRLDPKRIGNRMITFAWSVQEETGLTGAAKMARTMKPDYVFAVDTFVSSDSPLDDKRFAYAPVGKGAVIRAIDSSNVIPRQELDKLIGIAKNNNIRIQLANSRGGNDGSVFVPGGAANIPLSWPGAHAHSFIEKIHRADLQALVDLILAICREW